MIRCSPGQSRGTWRIGAATKFLGHIRRVVVTRTAPASRAPVSQQCPSIRETSDDTNPPEKHAGGYYEPSFRLLSAREHRARD